MKTIVFSTLHIRDAEHGAALAPELFDWHHRMQTVTETVFLCESAGESFAPSYIPTFCAGIPHTRPYHCKDWSYFQANMQFALFFILRELSPFDVVVMLQHDAILGVPLAPVLEEFTRRPEVLAAPHWSGSPDTHCLMMKPEACVDALYSLPFIAFPKVMGYNKLWIEHAYGALFRGRWWNPWPAVQTIRHEYGMPEQVKEDDAAIMRWPMLAKTSPALAERYKKEHPL